MTFCTREQERSIKTLIKRFFRRTPNGDLKNLESSISTELGGKDYKLSDFLTEDITKLLEKFGVDLSEMEDRTPSFKSNVIEEIASTEIDDLFHGLTLAKLYFDNYVNGLMVKNYFIGYGEAFLNNDEDLTKNFLRLKGELFNKIQQFLIDNKVINLKSPKDLYDDNFHITDYHHYESIMQYIADYFFSGNNFATIKSYSGKTVPNIDVNMDADSAIYEAYFNMILLSNFDSVLKKDYSHLVKVNTLYYNHLTSTPLNDTYTRVFEPESNMYWSNETHMEEGVESLNVKLVRMIADSIPAYDKSNNKTLYHLQLNDFYLLSSIIANFELLHGHTLKNMDGFEDFKYFSSDVPGRFEWYINTVKQVLDGQLTNDLMFDTFENYSNIIYSLYNYIHDPELNILEKEKNSDISLMAILGQVINNTFGASYTVNHTTKGLTVQQLYSEDFNSTGINNTVYSKMVANSHAKKFYDLQYKTTADKLNKVFEGIDPSALAKDVLSKNAHFSGKLRRYIHEILGIKLSPKSFRVAMESMEKTPGAKGIFTVQDLKEKLKDMIEGMQDDFTSDKFLDSLTALTGTRFDSTVGELVENTINKSLFKALSKGYLIDTPIKGVMNIKTHSGESIPSYKIPNLTYKDTELFSQQYDYENDESNPRIYRSLLITDTPAIVGTSTKLELINNKKNKAAGDFTPMESLLGDVNQEFFQNIIKNKKFNVIIGAYSDKSTILQKIINANFVINGKPIVENSIEDILETVRKQSQYYYHDTVETVFNAYKELFNIVGINPGTDLSIDNFEASVEAINNILSKHNISDLVVQAQAPHIKITAELHYTRYADGTFLNNLLLDNYRIFSSEDLFKEFVKRQEQSFLRNYSMYNAGVGKKIFLDNDVDDYLKAINIKKSDYPGENLKEVTLKNGELNPLLRKWLWINGLFRNEYLYLSAKGEYMHPIKGFPRRSGEINDDYWNSYLKESSARLSVMSKRNVAFTSTFEAPIRDSVYGVPTKINLAAIDDFQTSPYSITGDKKYKVKNGEIEGGQDAHDGSTWIDYTYSLMIDNSYPAKGYSGTKKQFGTLVTEGGVVIKKDAESVLTNRKILNSTNSSIRAYNLKKKMLSIPITDVELNYNVKLPESHFFNDRGKLYRIGEIQLFNDGNGVSLYTINYLKEGDNWILQDPIKYNINNLFDLWQAFGGQYSTDANGNFNESSNELLYKVMTANTELKNRLIHVLSNRSALKAGATNLNPSTSFTDNKPFAYATFSSRFMGPQLDASHSADESEIKEITQIISALAQGGFTSEIAREAYEDIQSIIKETANSYINNVHNIPDYLYKSVTDTFIKSIIESKGNNLAKVLVGNLKKDDIKIPFSNQNFYNAFVKELITKMNTDFISRNYPGLGAVLVPSEGMIQLYDITLPDGRTVAVTQESLIKEALENHDEAAFQQRYGVPSTNNYQIFQNYIRNILPNKNINIDEVEIGDTVEWNGKQYVLTTPEEYYSFKEQFNKNPDFVRNIENLLKDAFLQNKKDAEGVSEIFEQNPELANNVYETLGVNNVITSNDKIVWGHPAIGKTTMLESNPNAFIDWDNEFNRKRDSWIANKSNTVIGTPEFKKARNEYMINYNNHKDYVAFVKEEWGKAKEKANKENKILIASPHMLLNLFPNDFDKVITMSDKTFMDRAIKRSGGDEVNSKLWKEGINKTLQSIDKSKIIETDKFINDLFITPQQKQQVQQLYSQYLATIFPDSKVKDIVYHGANEPIEGGKFTKRAGATGGGIWFSGSKRYAQIQMDRAQPSESLIGRKLRGAPTMYQVVLNIKNPKHFYDATGALLVQTPREFEKQYDRTVNDAALFHHPDSKKPATADSADQVVVFEPEQIHILGDKQDIEGFKNFINRQNKIYKVYNKPRDLKPTLHTFNINGEKRNVFDLNGVKLRYYLESGISEKYNTILNNLSLYVSNKYFGEALPLESLDKNQRKLLTRFLNLWAQRDLSLMEHGYITRDVDENTNFSVYFFNDDLALNTVDDVLGYYSKNGQIINDVKFRPAEIIVSDIFKTKFGRDNISSYDLKKQKSNYFLEKLLKDFTPDKTKADIKINTTDLNHPVYIRFTDDLKRYNENLNLREVVEGERSVITRFNDQGERVYNLVNPRYVSTIMEDGKEIILIKKGTKYIDGGKVTGYHKTPNLEKIISDTIKSFKGSITSLIPLMKPNNTMKTFTYEQVDGKSTITGSEDYDFNTLINKQFNKFYNTNLELNENFLHMEALKREALGNIAQSAYASWLKSHDIIAARIPAQSMQSFMPMRVVEYSDDSKNDAFVSISQIWLQGSDFDIDKAYLLGYSFDNRGKYQAWSNLSNFSTKEQIDALDLLPMPTKNTLKIGSEGIDIGNFHLEIINNFDENSNLNSLSPEAIKSFNKLIRYINKNGVEEVTSSLNHPVVTIDFIVEAINRHNTDLTGISRSNSLKNGVVSKINRVISSPSNQLLANSPVSIDDWHQAVDIVKQNKETYIREDVVDIYNNSEELKKLGTIQQYSRYANLTSQKYIGKDFTFGSKTDITLFKEFMKAELDADNEIIFSPYDIISYYIQQYNASVGKADVGIAANGVKAFFGLTDYYNHFYKEEINNLSNDEIKQSGKVFNKSFAFYDSANNLKKFDINTIADLQISKNVKDRIEGLLGKPLQYLNNNAALNLSGFLSGATDNAKELLMAKVNATPDLASMHIYLTILGLEPVDVVEIMTSQVVSDILKRRESNLYVSEYDTSIEDVFEDLEKNYKDNPILENNLEVFKDLYYSSKELSALSGLFGVNQKRKANTWEVYKYLSRLERVFDSANEKFLSKIDLAEYSSETEMTLMGRAVKINPLLVDQARYMKTVLTNVRDIKVSHTDYDGTTREVTVNLMTDGLDFRYYINDPNYRQIVKDYYGLIKHTFNVFDVLDSVPHFAEMVNSLVLVHNRLSNSSKKYNFVTNTLKDIINKGDELVSDFNKSYIDSQVINKGIYFYDTKVIEEWLKTGASDVNFRIKDLMRLAKVSDYEIFISNEAKNIIMDKGTSPTVRNVNINDSSNPLLTLDSAHGIAQFKKTFEELILPIVQNRLQSEFTNYLKVESVLTPFSTRGSAIVSTFPLQELNNPVFIKQFQKLLNTFNFLDTDSKLKGLFTNSVGKELKIRDLFFIYNLITNNERYGNKRLTPILENYMQESDSLGYKYIKYWSDHEHGEGFTLDKSDPNWRESFEDSVLFHIANTEGKVSIKRDGKFSSHSINNPHFTLISDIALTREQETYRRNLYDTLRVIKEKGIIINLKC